MLRQFNNAERVVLLAILLNHFSYWPSIVLDEPSSSGLELAMLSGLLLFGYTYYHMHKRLISFVYMNLHVVWLIGWFAYGGLLTLFLTDNLSLNLLRLGYLASMILSMLSLALMIRHKTVRFNRLMAGWVYLALGLAPFIFGQYLLAGFTSISLIRDVYDVGVFAFPRAHGFAFEPLFLANWLLPPLLYLLYKPAKQLQKHRTGFVMIIGLLFFLTLSRGAFIALAVAVLVIVLRQRKTIPRLIATYLPLAGAFAVALFVSGLVARTNDSSFTNGIGRYLDHATLGVFNVEGASNAEELKRSAARQSSETGKPAVVLDTEGVVEDSTKGRVDASQTAINIYTRDPATIATGIGLFRFGEEANQLEPKKYPTTKEFTNNQLLDVLVETGVIGVGLLITFLVTSYSVMRNASAITAYIMLALLVQFATFSGYFLAPFWILLGCIIGSQQTRATKTNSS